MHAWRVVSRIPSAVGLTADLFAFASLGSQDHPTAMQVFGMAGLKVECVDG